MEIQVDIACGFQESPRKMGRLAVSGLVRLT